MSTYQGSGDPSLSEGLGKRLMTPGGAVAPAAAPELFGCIVLENDRPEMHFLEGSGLYARGTSQSAGGAGTRSSVQIINPFDAQSLVVVEEVRISVASGFVIVQTTTYPTNVLPFGTQSRGISRDTRSRTPAGAPRGSSAIVVTDNTLAVLAGATQAIIPDAAVLQQPFVLGPGGALYLVPNADNVAITYCSIIWRERRLNPSERI